MAEPMVSNPQAKVRIHQTRKAIFKKLYQLLKNRPDLTEEEALAAMEKETATLFDQMLSAHLKEAPPLDPAALKTKTVGRKRATHRDRTEHVGRFFIHTMEKQLREAGVQSCVIPVFARSVPMLLGDEAYNRFSDKINHLIQFATSKGFTYDQVLASKPGKEIMAEILRLYQAEFKNTPGFVDKLRNRLDEALVNYTAEQPIEDFNIEEAIDQALKAFLQSLKPPPPAA